jgi:predicted Zn-dependent protease
MICRRTTIYRDCPAALSAVQITGLWVRRSAARRGNTSRACAFWRQVQIYSSDYKLYGLQARTFAASGKRLQQHRAQAEFYFLQGQLGSAVEQLQFAQQAADGNFFEQSAVDARLRELRKLQAEEAKQKKNGV